MSAATSSHWGPLDSQDLHLFLLGPAYGESLCVFIPDRHWLVIDSFHLARSASPVRPLLKSYKAQVDGLILTHPHMDHAPGLGSLIEDYPDCWIGCSESWMDSWAQVNLIDDEAVQSAGAARQCLAAIHNHWREKPSSKWNLLQGTRKQIGEATLEVLHPTPAHLSIFRDSINRNCKVDLNKLSSPLLLEWKKVRLLLGADLPHSRWRRLEPGLELGRHTILKAPHHVSREAISTAFTAGSDSRTWLATPWNRKAPGLPRFDDDQGVHRALQYVKTLALTSLPFSGNYGPEVTRRSLLNVIKPSAPPGVVVTSPPLRSVGSECDGWIRVTVNEKGEVVRTDYGPDAIRVIN